MPKKGGKKRGCGSLVGGENGVDFNIWEGGRKEGFAEALLLHVKALLLALKALLLYPKSIAFIWGLNDRQ